MTKSICEAIDDMEGIVIVADRRKLSDEHLVDLDALDKIHTVIRDGIECLEQENTALKQALSIANEALAFYANTNNYEFNPMHHEVCCSINNGGECDCAPEYDSVVFSDEGRNARESQQKIKELGVWNDK